MSKQVRGATVLIAWREWKQQQCYFSFGQYDEETGRDSFGIDDDEIMFYCEGVEELEDIKTSGSEPFDVLEYVLEYVEAEGVEL